MNLKEMLLDRQLTSALIVDDGYDEVPKAQDLTQHNAAWEVFFSDVLEEDRKIIVEAFPKYEEMDANDLKASDAFVATVWSLRSRLRGELSNPLFNEYDQATKRDKDFLGKLETALQAIGIEPIRSGRNIPDGGKTVSIIFADLFLGATQIDSDIEASLSRLKDLLTGREASPPLVILMSSSSRLSEKKAYFRDNAPLLGAMFRVSKKEDLVNGTQLHQILMQLALHHKDALRLASFLHCWDIGLDAAKSRFLTTIRRLDLADYTQVRELLLNFEGQPLGSYVLEVFDRMLQHEIESDIETIQAAEELNKIQPDSYPPPYIAGSPDLQQLVYQTIYQNPKRLKVIANKTGAPVTFGDILIKRSSLQSPISNAPTTEVGSDVILILSPACDLVRKDFKQALMISGKLEQLTPKSWTYTNSARTPIVILPDDRIMWISWDIKDIRTANRDELNAMIHNGGTYQILIRLRESHAFELQQKLLADLGRVGLVARMPATFSVSIEAHTVDNDFKLQQLDLPTLRKEGGVCYAGRNEEGKQNSRIGLSQAAIDELNTAIAGIDKSKIPQKAHDTLDRLQMATGISASLHVPDFDKNGLAHLTIDTKDDTGKDVKQIVGLIVRNPKELITQLTGSDQKNGALVLIIRDQ